MQTTVSDETEVGGRCKRDAGAVEGRPGDGVVGKARRLQRRGRTLRNVHKRAREQYIAPGPACSRTPLTGVNASVGPYHSSCRRARTDQPHLARRSDRTHRVVPRLWNRHIAHRRWR